MAGGASFSLQRRLQLASVYLLILTFFACAPKSIAADTFFIRHPDDPGKRVEAFLQKPAGAGPWPTIVFLHGHQEWPSYGGKDFVDWGELDRFAKKGYLAVAVSQPGYGKSSGPADFCGPFTQHAVSAVIAKLKTDGLVAPNKIVIEGISRGALTGGMIATYDPSVAGVVLISGLYDLPQFSANPNYAQISKAFVAETGGSTEAMRERSVLFFAQDIKAAALILNGARDDRTDPAQGQRLANEINAHGGKARTIIYPNFGHHIPNEVRQKEVDAFVDNVLAGR
jgi:dipeptidyl aminopeptidase/acylaminoacyl peptidase